MLTVSSSLAATLLIRLTAEKLSPLAKAAGRKERSIRRVLLSAFRAAKGALDMQALEDSMSYGHHGTGAPLYVVQPVIDSLATLLMGESVTLTAQHVTYTRYLKEKVIKALPEVLRDTVHVGSRYAALELKMEFDRTNPEALEWAHQHAAEMVTNITDDVQDAIRLVVVQGFENGSSPYTIAQLIRGSIGLTERDAAAMMKRQLEDLSHGMSAQRAAERAERYGAKLIRTRALTIARTEALKAANEGQKQLWRIATKKGLLTSRDMKVWITADPCPICAPLEGETVPINSNFSVGQDPPLHPRCRCTVSLVMN